MNMKLTVNETDAAQVRAYRKLLAIGEKRKTRFVLGLVAAFFDAYPGVDPKDAEAILRTFGVSGVPTASPKPVAPAQAEQPRKTQGARPEGDTEKKTFHVAAYNGKLEKKARSVQLRTDIQARLKALEKDNGQYTAFAIFNQLLDEALRKYGY